MGFDDFSVTPGTYYVYEVNQTGWTQTAPSTVYYGPLVVSATTPTYLNKDFGNWVNKGRLKVDKVVTPTPASGSSWDTQKFSFTITGPNGYSQSFQLSNADDPSGLRQHTGRGLHGSRVGALWMGPVVHQWRRRQRERCVDRHAAGCQKHHRSRGR